MKWVLSGEPNELNAAKLKQDHLMGVVDLCAPSFAVQEIANSLWKATRRGRILQEDAQEALKILSDMRINLHEFNWIEISQALNIACQLELSIYDSAYLILSGKLKSDLITADDLLFKKAKDRFKAVHIKDYL